MRERRSLRLAAAGLLAVLGLVALPWPAPPADGAEATVDDATFTWAISGYAQAGVFGPWTLSGATGSARVVTTTPGELDLAPVPATSLPATVESVDAVRFSGGTGTVDRSTGAMTLAWRGGYRVNAYPPQFGAPTEIYRDPELRVAADGSGTLSMLVTLGAGSDMDGNPTAEEDLGRRTVLTFAPGALEQRGDDVRLTPAYGPVTVDGQATRGWSQPFLDALAGTSVVAHFHDTGASKDVNKPALPVDVALGEVTDPTPPSPTTPPPTTPPTTPPDPQEPPAGDVTGEDVLDVDDAQLRWGLNHESNNASHAPGRYNFLSAGKLPDPGRGGSTVTAGQWRQRAGDVRVEKHVRGRGYVPASWAGLRTGPDGAVDTSATDDVFTGHQVVLDGGTGTVDPDAGDATVRWTGSFTVVFYSGYTFFHVTDPVLVVRDGRARVTATLSGYGSSLGDQSVWRELAPRTATIADLGRVDLTADDGFTVTPRYDRVKVDVPASLAPQVRRGADWGAFPQPFVDFQVEAGTAPFWYSSGGSTDAAKKALPLTVSYDASAPVEPAAPVDGGGTPAGSSAGAGGSGASAAAPADAPAALPTAAATPVPSASGPLATLAAASPPADDETSGPLELLAGDAGWWAGGALLLAAAGLALPLPLPRLRP